VVENLVHFEVEEILCLVRCALLFGQGGTVIGVWTLERELTASIQPNSTKNTDLIGTRLPARLS
jgi:hypothetical protein